MTAIDEASSLICCLSMALVFIQSRRGIGSAPKDVISLLEGDDRVYEW